MLDLKEFGTSVVPIPVIICGSSYEGHADRLESQTAR